MGYDICIRNNLKLTVHFQHIYVTYMSGRCGQAIGYSFRYLFFKAFKGFLYVRLFFFLPGFPFWIEFEPFLYSRLTLPI